jgi:hypothetical protein
LRPKRSWQKRDWANDIDIKAPRITFLSVPRFFHQHLGQKAFLNQGTTNCCVPSLQLRLPFCAEIFSQQYFIL